MKSKKWIFIGITVLALSGVGYYYLKDVEISCTRIPTEMVHDGGTGYICGLHYPPPKSKSE